MSHQDTGNAVRSGVFVIATVLLAATVIIVLAGVPEKLRPTSEYVVRFDLREGAAGLEADSPVRIGGRDVGRVKRVNFEGSSDNVKGVLVTIVIDEGLVVREGATAFLERPLLGSGATLNFESLGAEDGAAIAEGGTIPGEPQVPQFMAQAGFGSTQREQLQAILARSDRFTQEFEAIVADVRRMTEDARERSGGWFDRADSILARADEATGDLREGIEEGRTLVSTVQERVDANRDRVDAIIANTEAATADARDFTAHVNETTRPRIDELLDEGARGLDAATAAIERVGDLIAAESPSVRKTLANARLASDQLRLTMGEVRRTPWRLLYRPSERELEFELLYDAMRTYATAVSDLRAAGESLGAVAESDALGAEEAARRAEAITDAFTRYREAEERFLELLTSRTP